MFGLEIELCSNVPMFKAFNPLLNTNTELGNLSTVIIGKHIALRHTSLLLIASHFGRQELDHDFDIMITRLPLWCWWLILPIQNDAKDLKND